MKWQTVKNIVTPEIKGVEFIRIDKNRLPKQAVLFVFDGCCIQTSPCQGKGYAIVFAIPMKKDFADWRKCFYFVGANQNIEACYGF